MTTYCQFHNINHVTWVMCPRCFDTLLTILNNHCSCDQIRCILSILLGDTRCPNDQHEDPLDRLERCQDSGPPGLELRRCNAVACRPPTIDLELTLPDNLTDQDSVLSEVSHVSATTTSEDLACVQDLTECDWHSSEVEEVYDYLTN